MCALTSTLSLLAAVTFSINHSPILHAAHGKILCFVQATVSITHHTSHIRDIVEALVVKKCSSKGDFDWQMQLRYEYEPEADQVVVRQVNAR